ncbi:MAG: hypothetical protein FWC50_13195 [Planctomycetaceae bacterium]|nr:hypothetical protein [Planctomycetaceae bacterium]
MNESSPENPYQASLIDEKPVEMVRFFHAEPVPKKLFKESLVEATWHGFINHKREFAGLGFAQILFFFLPATVIYWFLSQHPDVLKDYFVTVSSIVCLFLLGVLIYVVSISATLRLLRKEPMVFFSDWREAVSLLTTLFHASIYLVISLSVVALVVLLMVAPIGSFFNGRIFLANDNVWILLFLLFMLTVIFGSVLIEWLFARFSFGIHFIVDRKSNFWTAFRQSWWFTKGNTRAITTKRRSFFRVLLVLMLIVTCGLGIFVLFGYYYCSVTVTYLMMTGQCELVSELPDEW